MFIKGAKMEFRGLGYWGIGGDNSYGMILYIYIKIRMREGIIDVGIFI